MFPFSISLLTLLFCTNIVASHDTISQVIEVQDESWQNLLEGEWIIRFYAPWCPACKASESDYENFSKFSRDLKIKVANVDVTQQPGLSGRFIITSLPTFYHAKDGVFRRYNGQRTSAAFREYIFKKEWKETDPISWFRSPNSIPMTLMSYLFRVSVAMKDLHDTITVTYQLPAWVSYLFFGVATISLGLVLGMIFILIIDAIYPCDRDEKPVRNESPAVDKCSEEEEEEENEDEESSEVTESENDAVEDQKDLEVEVEEDTQSQDSQESSHTPKGWEKITEKDVVEAESDEAVRKRTVKIIKAEESDEKDECLAEEVNEKVENEKSEMSAGDHPKTE